MEMNFSKIIFFEISSRKIFGKKIEKNNVIKNKKIYCIPLKEFITGNNPTGTR